MADIASSALMQARQTEAAMNQTTLARAATKEDIELAEQLINHSRAPQNGGDRAHEAQNGRDVSGGPQRQQVFPSREAEVGIDGALDQSRGRSSRSGTAERDAFGPQSTVLSAGQKCRCVITIVYTWIKINDC